MTLSARAAPGRAAHAVQVDGRTATGNALPRDLADVLHYFLPELEDPPSEPGRSASEGAAPDATRRPDDSTGGGDGTAGPPPLPVLGLPIGDRDVVRAALAWNLAIETARLGGATSILAPEIDRGSPLWPEPGVGPLGCQLLFCPAKDLDGLYAAAVALARSQGATARNGGAIFLRIPPEWLAADAPPRDHVRWHLLLSGASAVDLEESVDVAHTLARSHPGSEIGLSVHGVQRVAEAKTAFERASRRLRDVAGQDLISYGLLVDDLHVYRAIAAQRPIGLAHPQSPAARALADVARLIYEDARSRVLG